MSFSTGIKIITFCLVFNKDARLKMEKQAHQRGYQMRWKNTAWGLLQYIDFVKDTKDLTTGISIEFKREKPSVFQKSCSTNDDPLNI